MAAADSKSKAFDTDASNLELVKCLPTGRKLTESERMRTCVVHGSHSLMLLYSVPNDSITIETKESHHQCQGCYFKVKTPCTIHVGDGRWTKFYSCATLQCLQQTKVNFVAEQVKAAKHAAEEATNPVQEPVGGWPRESTREKYGFDS